MGKHSGPLSTEEMPEVSVGGFGTHVGRSELSAIKNKRLDLGTWTGGLVICWPGRKAELLAAGQALSRQAD